MVNNQSDLRGILQCSTDLSKSKYTFAKIDIGRKAGGKLVLYVGAAGLFCLLPPL
jgi:hypothetical protein